VEEKFEEDHRLGREGNAMIKSNKLALLLLIIPSLVLLLLAFQKSQSLRAGKEVVLSISGYDPRDLLAGHYLVYTIDYGFDVRCEYERLHMKKSDKDAYICLDTKTLSFESPESSCKLFIKGKCDYGRFIAGIERYYIPQEKAQDLEKIVLKNKSKIKLSVLPNGTAMVKDILFVE
jgi:uncharacterized membrane-anchored protein